MRIATESQSDLNSVHKSSKTNPNEHVECLRMNLPQNEDLLNGSERLRALNLEVFLMPSIVSWKERA